MINYPNQISRDDTNREFVEARSMRRVSFGLTFLAALTAVAFAGCSDTAPVNQVGVNVVQKEIFEVSWYVGRTVIDVDYEAAGAGTFPGDTAYDHATRPPTTVFLRKLKLPFINQSPFDAAIYTTTAIDIRNRQENLADCKLN